MIIEPTLEHYVYYLRRVESDNLKAVQERRATFEEELRTLLAHLERLSGQTIPKWKWPQESENRRISQRIVRTGWLDNPTTDRSCFVEARTYSDVYWLQVGYYQQGETEAETFADLCNKAWQPATTDHLLGSSTYLCGIVTDQMDDLAIQTLTVYTNSASDTILSTHLANGCVRLYGLPHDPYVAALLYSDAECEAWAGQTIINDAALRLELYKHKVDRQLAWCEENLRVLSEQEQALRGLLEQVNDALQGSAQLLQQLARLYRVFSGNVGMLTERQMTIGINLDNLDAVLEGLKPLVKDRLLGATRDRLRKRQAQLEADLAFADHSRQQAERTISAFTVEMALERSISPPKIPSDAVLIQPAGWPGVHPLFESEIEVLTPRSKPSQSAAYPRIEVSPRITKRLSAEDKALLQQVYRGYGRVLVEKEFGGGFGGARVLRVLPVTSNGRSSARKVTKIGPVTELREERDNYVKYVEEHLPFYAARVEWARYCERDDQAGLNYVSIGGGSLGQVVDLEEYYHSVPPDDIGRIVGTLGDLLDKELGQNWYDQNDLLRCFFAAEYSQHMVGHLRLQLRPESPDALWPVGQPPVETKGYEQVKVEDIPYEYKTKETGALLSIVGMVVKKIKHCEVKLEDPDRQGIIVRVEFDEASDTARELQLGDEVGIRGEVVYNRYHRMEEIIRSAFPDLSPKISDEYIELPGVEGTYPNPLQVYPDELGRMLKGRKSYVHGDLHLRNVLVDESRKGWLIDFAKIEMRHNLFDFIKLETYVRMMELGRDGVDFLLSDYVQFETALADATLRGKSITLGSHNVRLQVAYQVILTIRQIARKYMGREPDFRHEYYPALFLYNLAVTKYYQEERPRPTQLSFATACVLGRYIRGEDDQARLSSQPPKGDGEISSSQQSLGTGNRWAVLIGVNEYKDKANYGRLHVCAEDVEAVREQLVAGGFYPARIRLLTDHTPDEPPSRANILTALKAVADATEPDDLLLFYYSGHGDEESGESYLVARDGQRLVLSDTAVPVSRVKKIMEQAPARAKVIVLDACHSGADIGGKGSRPMSAEFIRRVFEEAEGMAILASCKQGQLSYEWHERKRSVFTHFLLEALTGKADRGKKGFVTVHDTSNHVTDGVKLWASQRNTSQTPTLQYTVVGDIILVRHS